MQAERIVSERISPTRVFEAMWLPCARPFVLLSLIPGIPVMQRSGVGNGLQITASERAKVAAVNVKPVLGHLIGTLSARKRTAAAQA
jgi:hypothetical protein